MILDSQFVVIMRDPDGRSRIAAHRLITLTEAEKFQLAATRAFPPHRYEIAIATRSDRRQIAEYRAALWGVTSQQGNVMPPANPGLFPGKSP